MGEIGGFSRGFNTTLTFGEGGSLKLAAWNKKDFGLEEREEHNGNHSK